MHKIAESDFVSYIIDNWYPPRLSESGRIVCVCVWGGDERQ